MPDRKTRAPTGYRPALTRFARILLTLGSGASPWLIVAFVLGVLALGVFANFVFGAVYDPSTLSWERGLRVVIGVGVLVGLAYASYRYDLRQAWQRNFRPIFQRSTALPHAGLIWLLSPSTIDLPEFAITHHYAGEGGERLRHCWLLITRGAQPTFATLAERVSELGLDVELHPVYLNAETIEATYNEVDTIYRTQASQVGLSPIQVIADLSGGLKPMTAGMVLACLPYGRALEYVESDRDESGQPVEGSLRAVLVGVDFQMGR